MYGEFTDSQPFYQGDILKESPFFIISKNFDKPKNPPIIKNISVMMLSQTCDIQQRDFVIIGRIATVQELKDATEVNNNFLKGLRNRKIKYYFYLPKDNVFEESYVDFTQIIYMPKSIFKKENRIKSLSDLGRHWLAYQISDYFGRPFEPTK